MSHDAWLVTNIEGEEVEIAEIGNYTRNVSPMWRKAMAAAAGKPMAIQDTDGWPAWEALLLFAPAADHMAAHRDEYEPMNPPNGWGSYEGALEYMRKCVAACAANPTAKVRWSV